MPTTNFSYLDAVTQGNIIHSIVGPRASAEDYNRIASALYADDTYSQTAIDRYNQMLGENPNLNAPDSQPITPRQGGGGVGSRRDVEPTVTQYLPSGQPARPAAQSAQSAQPERASVSEVAIPPNPNTAIPRPDAAEAIGRSEEAAAIAQDEYDATGVFDRGMQALQGTPDQPINSNAALWQLITSIAPYAAITGGVSIPIIARIMAARNAPLQLGGPQSPMVSPPTRGSVNVPGGGPIPGAFAPPSATPPALPASISPTVRSGMPTGSSAIAPPTGAGTPVTVPEVMVQRENMSRVAGRNPGTGRATTSPAKTEGSVTVRSGGGGGGGRTRMGGLPPRSTIIDELSALLGYQTRLH